MKKGELRSRARSGREQRRVVLIVCEGKKTEPLYFGHFREALRSVASIKLVSTNTTDAPGLARDARTQSERYGLETKKGDRAWIVFDADENSQAQIDECSKIAHRIDADIALSNPCFELWYLLHFEDRKEAIDRKDALARLHRHLPDYGKGIDCCDALESVKTTAMERARALEARWGAAPSLSANPSTGVWRLVEELEGMLK